MQHISYPSTGQFRDVIRTVRDRANWDNVPVPTLKFRGTTKLHGTCSSVVLDYSGMYPQIYAQSRERVLSIESDNYGFAAFVHKNKDLFFDALVKSFNLEFPCPDDTNKIIFYGEWAGQGVQKGVGISNIPKSLFIFAIKTVSGEGENEVTQWYSSERLMASTIFNDYLKTLNDNNIYFIDQYPTWEIDIDFNKPELAQNRLVELTNAVEQECPVSKSFGFENTVGEGIVWKAVHNDNFNTSGLMFKVKGKKHSESKVKTLAEVDPEKVAGQKAFVEYAVTDYRLNKLLDKFKENGYSLEVESTGEFIKSVCKDVISEESDTLVESNLVWKEVAPRVSNKARNFYLEKLNQEIFNKE